MSKILSEDIRQRVVDYVGQGHSARAAARRFNVSPNFAITLVRRWKLEGHIKPRFRGRVRGTGKLGLQRDYLCSLVDAIPDITMPELAERLWLDKSVKAHPGSLCRFLRSEGYTYKKNFGRVRA